MVVCKAATKAKGGYFEESKISKSKKLQRINNVTKSLIARQCAGAFYILFFKSKNIFCPAFRLIAY